MNAEVLSAAARCDHALLVLSRQRIPDATRDDALLGGWLDSPQSGEFWPAVKVSGWLLARDPEATVEVICRDGGREYRSEANVARHDVVQKLGVDAERVVCGFAIYVPVSDAGGVVEVLVRIASREHVWWRLELGRCAQPDARAAAWRGICGRPGSMPVAQVAEDAAAYAVQCFGTEYRQFDSPEAIAADPSLADVGQVLGELFLEFANPSVPWSMYSQAASSGALRTRSRCHGEAFQAIRSNASHDENYLWFRGGGMSFVLIQYVQSSIALYIPERGVALSWTSWRNYVKGFAQQALRVALCDGWSGDRSGAAAKFGGIILGNSRPYHYFYDQLATLPALDATASTGHALVQLPSYSYLRPEHLGGVSCRLLDDAGLNQLSAREGTFWLLWGASSEALPDRRARIEDVGRLADEGATSGSPTLDLAPHFPVLWLGVSAQKRVWCEQTEGLALIIESIAARFPGLAVVFDGWTSPLAPQPGDAVEIARDREVVAAVLERVSRPIPHVDLVGAGSAEKIRVARQCDYYVANWLQGSLHVDNFAQRPGVGHFNTHWPAFATLYEHHDCRRIDDQLIRNESGERADMVNYHIEPQAVLDALLALMDDIPISQVRGAAR